MKAALAGTPSAAGCCRKGKQPECKMHTLIHGEGEIPLSGMPVSHRGIESKNNGIV